MRRRNTEDILNAVVVDDSLRARDTAEGILVRAYDEASGALKVQITGDLVDRVTELEERYVVEGFFKYFGTPSGTDYSLGSCADIVGQTGEYLLNSWPDGIDIVVCGADSLEHPDTETMVYSSGSVEIYCPADAFHAAAGEGFSEGDFSLNLEPATAFCVLFVYRIQRQYLDSTKTLPGIDVIALSASLPQPLETTDSPTFAEVTLSGLTAGRSVVTDGSKTLSSIALTGFISGCGLAIKDADEFYIDAGTLDLSGTLHTISSRLTKSTSSLTASATYHVYAKPPASGIDLSATEIEYSATAPTYDPAKAAGYHGTNTTWRWIGWFETDGSSNVIATESVAEMNAVPIGTLRAFLVRETAPFGYMEMNGSTISRTTYADFIYNCPAAIRTAFGSGDGSTTVTLPDLRGLFPRIWAHGSSKDPDRATRTNLAGGSTLGDIPGSYQADKNLSHTHQVSSNWTGEGPFQDASCSIMNGGSPAAGNRITLSSGGNQSNPKNINVAVYCKYLGRL